jgi:hypothetical protein
MGVQLMYVYLGSGSLANLLNAADMVKMSVGEEYLSKSESFHFQEFKQQPAVAAYINGNAAPGSCFDYIAV